MKFLWFTSSPTSAKTYDVVKNGLEPAEGIQNTTFCGHKKFQTLLFFSLGLPKNFKNLVVAVFGHKKGFLAHGSRKNFGSRKERVTNPKLVCQG